MVLRLWSGPGREDRRVHRDVSYPFPLFVVRIYFIDMFTLLTLM